MTLGERIKQRRTELGLSQAELASRLDYGDRSTIAKIESGKNDLNQSKIILFAEALNTTPSFLMGWTDDPTNYDDPDLIASIPLSYLEACNGDAEKAFKMMEAAHEDAKQENSNISIQDIAQNEHEKQMLLLARHMEPIPEEDREALKKQFQNSIDLYLKAKGLK